TYFIVGRPWGLEGVALAQAVLETGGWAIRHTMANRILNLSWRQFARSLSPLWIAHGLYVLLVIALRRALLIMVAGTSIRLAVGLLLAALAYLVVLRGALPGLLTTLRRGVVDSFSHGISQSPTDPQVAQTSTAI